LEGVLPLALFDFDRNRNVGWSDWFWFWLCIRRARQGRGKDERIDHYDFNWLANVAHRLSLFEELIEHMLGHDTKATLACHQLGRQYQLAIRLSADCLLIAICTVSFHKSFRRRRGFIVAHV
jgi:hypothetical protein